MTIALNLKTLREGAGLNQRQLANKIEIVPSMINRIEAEVIKNPKMETLVKIADALDTSIDLLVRPNREVDAEEVLGTDKRAHELVDVYRKLSPRDKQMLIGFARFLRNQ